MAPAAAPDAGINPIFVKEEPFDSPRDIALVDWFRWLPVVFARVEDAERWTIGRMPQAINVLQRFAGASRVRADLRVKNEDADAVVGKGEMLEVLSRVIDDANAILLADGPQRSFPNTDPC